MKTDSPSVSDVQEISPDDVASLMARLQVRAARQATQADLLLRDLRSSSFATPQCTFPPSGASEVQGEANQLFHRLIGEISDEAASAPFHDLVDTGHVTRSPKRMVALLKQRVLAGQESFNLELIGRISTLMESLSHARHFDLLVAVAARLIGSVNAIVQSLGEIERIVESRANDEAAWRREVFTVLEKVVTGVPNSGDGTAGSGDQELFTSSTAGSLEFLKAFVNDTHEIASGLADAAAEIAALKQSHGEVNKRFIGHVSELSVQLKHVAGESGQTRQTLKEVTGQLMEHLAELARKVAAVDAEASQMRVGHRETTDRVMSHMGELAGQFAALAKDTYGNDESVRRSLDQVSARLDALQILAETSGYLLKNPDRQHDWIAESVFAKEFLNAVAAGQLRERPVEEVMGYVRDLTVKVQTALSDTNSVRTSVTQVSEQLMGYMQDLTAQLKKVVRETGETHAGLNDASDRMMEHVKELAGKVQENSGEAIQLRQRLAEVSADIMSYVSEVAAKVASVSGEAGQVRKSMAEVTDQVMHHVKDATSKVASMDAFTKHLARRHDETSELVMGHVQDISSRLKRIESGGAGGVGGKVVDTLMNHITALSVRIQGLEKTEEANSEHRREQLDRFEQLDRRLRELELRSSHTNTVEAPNRTPFPAPRAEIASFSSPMNTDSSAVPIGGPEFDFLVWENVTRGEEATISVEQQKYIPWFQGTAHPILDGGCGRGEFLELLKEAGIKAYGVDMDPSMVRYCVSKGLSVEQAELFAHLESLSDDSLGGIFLGQVVEHIPPAHLHKLTNLVFSKLVPGGAIIMETINPTCLTTFSGAFYADPTHQKPVHPRALEYFLTSSGFGPTEIVFSAPIPPEEKLSPLREEAPLDPTIKSLVLQMNQNFDRLNSVLYNFANYAAAARKPMTR